MGAGLRRSPVHGLPRLATARLFLRAPQLRDCPHLARQLNDIEVSRWLGRVPYPYGLADARRFVTRIAPRELSWVIVRDADGAVLGTVGLHRGAQRTLELGYWLGRGFAGQGYATEAGRAVVEYAARELGGPALTAGYFSRNRGSARVLEKLGFVPWRTGEAGCAAVGVRFARIEVRMPAQSAPIAWRSGAVGGRDALPTRLRTAAFTDPPAGPLQTGLWS